MELTLIILGAICMLVGLAGTIVPVLPGIPISYVGLLLLHFTDKVQFSPTFLIIWAVVTIVVTVIDFVLPTYTTKLGGGSKAGVWGSTIGLIIGLFIGPLGIILGPFVGAVVGELLSGKEFVSALKSGGAAFLGFLCGTILKLVCAGLMIYYFVAALVG